MENKTINIHFSSDENKELSNMAKRPFIFGGTQFKSVEHFYQAMKFLDARCWFSAPDKTRMEMVQKIVSSTNPFESKRIGKVKPRGWKFNAKYWADKSLSYMFCALYHSFSQNDDAKQLLMDTGDANLTHKQEKGRWGKEFPKLLMHIRNVFKMQEEALKRDATNLDLTKIYKTAQASYEVV